MASPSAMPGRDRGAELAGAIATHARARLPTCRECRKPVRELDARYDSTDGTITVRVRCHGERRERVVSAAEVRNAIDFHELGPLIDAARQPWFFMPPPGPEVP